MLVMRSEGRTRKVPRGFSGSRSSVSASFREMRLKYQLWEAPGHGVSATVEAAGNKVSLRLEEME